MSAAVAVLRKAVASTTGGMASTFQLEREAIEKAEAASAEKLNLAGAAVTAAIESIRAAVNTDTDTSAAERAHEAASAKLVTAQTAAGIARVAHAARRDALAARIARHRRDALQEKLVPLVEDLGQAQDTLVAVYARLSDATAARDRAAHRVDVVEGRLAQLGVPIDLGLFNHNRDLTLEEEALSAFQASHRAGVDPMRRTSTVARVTVAVELPEPAHAELLEEDDELAATT